MMQAGQLDASKDLLASLQETRRGIDQTIKQVSESIMFLQEQLRAHITDPRQVLQGLCFLDPSFQATDDQVGKICAAFGWKTLDIYPLDSRGYELREGTSSDGIQGFRVFVKGTDIDVTDKKASEWQIVNDKLEPKLASSSTVVPEVPVLLPEEIVDGSGDEDGEDELAAPMEVEEKIVHVTRSSSVSHPLFP
jgi:hypothetical protein